MESNGQSQQVQVNMQIVVSKLTEQIARLTFELAMTQAALEEALQRESQSGSTRSLDEDLAGI